jgi:hypothetical protein
MTLRRVTLALATGPGFPEGSPEHRYEIEIALDGAGRPDAAAWEADPEPWRAQGIVPGQDAVPGDVQHEPDHGWSIRFYRAAAEGPDAPETRIDWGSEPVRPGEYAAVTEPDGTAWTYRVVNVA